MGFRDRLNEANAAAKARKQELKDRADTRTERKSSSIDVVFGPDFERGLTRAAKEKASNIQILFPNLLLQEIWDCIKEHGVSERVLYSATKQRLDVVGESFRQDVLREVVAKYNDEDFWYCGFLLPEPINAHDENAVAVVLIDQNDGADPSTLVVGYLPRALAARVQRKILQFLARGQVIPLVLRLAGGDSKEFPYVGVVAMAVTDSISFK
jgi:hypothetical protein